MRPNQHRSPSARRVRWTPLERGLLALSVLIMSLSVAAEAYRWLAPPSAPAAPRVQEATTPTVEQATEIAPTDVPATEVPPTSVPPTEVPPTEVPPTSVPPTEVPPTDVPATEVPPTSVPPTEVPPTATSVIQEPPLTLDISASSSTVAPGRTVNYTIIVNSTSDTPQTVDVQLQLGGAATITGLSAQGGSCANGTPARCTVQAQRNKVATISVTVQISSTTTAGSLVSVQALAQDATKNTAASSRVTVQVVQASQAPVIQDSNQQVPTATSTPEPTNVPQAASTKQPVQAPDASQATATPTNTPSPGPQETASAADATTTATTSAPMATASSTPVQSTGSQAAQSTSSAVQLPPTAVLPTVIPGSRTSPQQNSNVESNLLPNTAATSTTFGFGGALMALALTLNVTRRTRKVSRRFAEQTSVAPPLLPLIEQTRALQHRTVEEIERMREQTQRFIDRLRERP